MSGGDKQTKPTPDMASLMRRRAATDDAVPRRCALMTGVALAILQTQSATALTLGELRVQSAIGQPFVGTTTARLGPGESIASACVSAPAGGNDGFSNPEGLRVTAQAGNTPGDYPVQVRSAKPLYEPMYEIRLQVDCPGGVALAKSYVVMLNLPMTNAPEQAATAQAPARAATVQARPRNVATTANTTTTRNSATTGRLSPSREGIPAGEQYRVRNGDTLSTIAERVQGRPVGSTWNVAAMLFERNPQAFVRGNRDMLKLGALLDIPDAATLAGEVNAAPARQASIAPLRPTSTGSAANGTELARREEFTADTTEAASDSAATAGSTAELSDTDLSASNEALLAEIRAANAAADTSDTASQPESPFADEVSLDSVAGSEASLAAEETAAAQPDMTPALGTETNETRSSMSPLVAVASGIGLGVLLALLLLGRNLLGTLREARARREAALAGAARANADASREHKPVRPAYGGAGIDVEVGSAPAASAEESDTADATGMFEAPVVEAPVVETPEADTPVAAAGDSPRVSLRPATEPARESDFDNMLEELEKTERFEAPALNTPLDESGTHESGLSDSQTMRSLFEETASDPQPGNEETVEITAEMQADMEPTAEMPADAGPTAEMPAFEAADDAGDDGVDIDVNDLESLSRRLEETSDDTLSKTLTQALGLLEQDYEEELTASQILEKKEVEAAFEQQRRED